MNWSFPDADKVICNRCQMTITHLPSRTHRDHIMAMHDNFHAREHITVSRARLFKK